LFYKSKPYKPIQCFRSLQKLDTKPHDSTQVQAESKFGEGPIKLVLNMKDVWSKQGKDSPCSQIPQALPKKRGRPRRNIVEPILPRVQQGLLVVRQDPTEGAPKPPLPKLTLRENPLEENHHSLKKKKKFVN
jgi:hypothetical protein